MLCGPLLENICSLPPGLKPQIYASSCIWLQMQMYIVCLFACFCNLPAITDFASQHEMQPCAAATITSTLGISYTSPLHRMVAPKFRNNLARLSAASVAPCGSRGGSSTTDQRSRRLHPVTCWINQIWRGTSTARPHTASSRRSAAVYAVTHTESGSLWVGGVSLKRAQTKFEHGASWNCSPLSDGQGRKRGLGRRRCVNRGESLGDSHWYLTYEFEVVKWM